jgi:adenylate cyclase
VRYHFEDYVLDTDRHELRRLGMIVPTAPQVVDLLAYLVQHRGRIVTKEQLVATVWEGRSISDSALTTRLNVLRSAIGDSGRNQRLIKTFPRKGLRFIGDVHGVQIAAFRDETRSSDLPSIAVLPFTNLSGDPSQDFFGDVIAEEVLTELARLRWLLVIARNSSFTFRGTAFDVQEIGRQLDVRYVLEGSARHANGRFRVACRLIETHSALQVWSSRYDVKLSDAFQLQDEIRDAILTELAPAILDAERKRVARRAPDTLTAWESYQRGVAQMLRQSVEGNNSARQFFQQAVVLEPHCSRGYDGLAWTHLVEATAFSRISIEEGCKRSEPLARIALELDSENTGARARLALTLHLRGENQAALGEAERALSSSPNCADACGVRGTALVFSGEYTAGRASLERFLRLSPRDPARPIRLSQIAASFYFEKDYENAERVARRTIQEHPTVPMAYRWLAASLGQLRRFAEGARVVANLRHTYASSLAMYVNRPPPYFRIDDHQHMMDGLAKAGWR